MLPALAVFGVEACVWRRTCTLAVFGGERASKAQKNTQNNTFAVVAAKIVAWFHVLSLYFVYHVMCVRVCDRALARLSVCYVSHVVFAVRCGFGSRACVRVCMPGGYNKHGTISKHEFDNIRCFVFRCFS